MFSLSTIGHIHHFSDDPDLNSVLVFITMQTENRFAAMHLFQSDRVPVCTFRLFRFVVLHVIAVISVFDNNVTNYRPLQLLITKPISCQNYWRQP